MGNHTNHTFTFTAPEPLYTRYRFIQADDDTETLPQYAMLMKHTSGGWAALPNHRSPADNRFLRCGTSSFESGKDSMTITSSSGGSHNHGTVSGADAGSGHSGMRLVDSNRGSHTHTFDATLTYDLYRRVLSAWYDPSEDNAFDFDNAIGMYPSLTPPDNWSLCDGTNGTPDMRNRFVSFTNDDNEAGDAHGDGRVNCATGSTSTNGAHGHLDTLASDAGQDSANHPDSYGSHSHSMNDPNVVWMPATYALAFIMYTG